MTVCLAVAGTGIALYFKVRSDLDRQASTWSRFLVSLRDTNTGLIEVINGEDKVYYASPEARGILGYAGEEMKGMPLAELMPDAMGAEHTKIVLTAMDGARRGHIARRVSAITCKGRRMDGSEIDLVLRIFIGKDSVIALFNLAEETRYVPLVPLESPEPKAPPKK